MIAFGGFAKQASGPLTGLAAASDQLSQPTLDQISALMNTGFSGLPAAPLAERKVTIRVVVRTW